MTIRTAITGMGVISPLGHSLDEFWQGLATGSTPRAHPDCEPEYMDVRHTYWVPDRSDYLDRSKERGHAVGFGLAAASAAFKSAGYNADELRGRRVGVVVGNAMGDDRHELARRQEGIHVDGDSGFGLADLIAQQAGLTGPCLDVSTACSASLYAIAIAREWVESGLVDTAIAGGAEAVSRVAMGCFNRLSAFDDVACRPFDAGRRGTVMGEGAAMVVVERDSAARRAPWGQIRGAGWSCDAHHSTIPEPQGQQPLRAIRRALSESELEPRDIDLVLAHGTGTHQNDQMEANLVAELFADTPEAPWVYSVKGALGHSGGAAGAFQVVAGALMLERQRVLPNANLQAPDPAHTIRLSRVKDVASPLSSMLINSYAFGGNNVTLLLSRTPESGR